MSATDFNAETRAIDTLFLELSQFTKARTKREIELLWLLRECLDRMPDWETGINKDLLKRIKAAIQEAEIK